MVTKTSSNSIWEKTVSAFGDKDYWGPYWRLATMICILSKKPGLPLKSYGAWAEYVLINVTTILV